MERWTGTPEGTCNVLRMFRETHAISARSSSTTRQKDRRQEKPHSVRFFCFVVFRPHSLLDFLESRVMKRKSINHCEERSEMERWKILHSAKDLDVGIAICIVVYVI